MSDDGEVYEFMSDGEREFRRDDQRTLMSNAKGMYEIVQYKISLTTVKNV